MSIEFTGPEGFRYKITTQGMYSDGVPFVKGDVNLIAENADSLTVKADSLLEFMTAMFVVDAVNMKRHWAGKADITRIVLPYLPGARQDRINDDGDILFTSLSIADTLLAHGFDEVVALDIHSAQSAGFVKGLRHYPIEKVAERMWHGYSGIIAPDHGAKNRAERVAQVMGLPVYYGEKKRDVSNGRLSGFAIDVPAGGHYLVVDDICDGGGTFVGLGEKIKECGAYADLFVSHGIFAKGTTALKKYYKNIYTTDSRDHAAPGVYTIRVVEDMENY